MAQDKKSPSAFPKIPKSTKKKKRGLAKPPVQSQAGNNTKLKEGAPAVPVKASVARTHRVNTNISEVHGDTLDNLIIAIKKAEGKKPSIAEILERGIDLLNSKYK